MYLFTGNQCLICYKECSDSTSAQKDAATALSVQTFLNKNAEICRRFCTLATRYLDLDPYFYNPMTTITSKRAVCCERACQDCTEMLSQFCELYQQIEYLQLQLSWRAHEIAQVMKHADKEDGEHAVHRKALEEKFIKIGSKIEDIDDFRKEFIEQIEIKRKAESFPNIKVVKGKSEEEDDADFIVVKVKQGEKRKPDDSDENSVESSEKLTSTGMQVDKPIKDSTSKSSSSSISASNKDLKLPETGGEKRLASNIKRPKISLKNNKHSSTIRETESHSKATGEGFDRNISDKTDDDPTNDYKGAHMSNNTVIILKNETKNLDLISNDFSSQYQDNVLLRNTFTINHDKLLAWKSNGLEGQGDMPGFPSDAKIRMPTSSEGSLDTNRYYKQFDYLQYKCPFPHCGKMFNTMTRITLHQKATGHNLNAVINIISK